MVKVESEQSSRETDADPPQKACCSRWWNKLFGNDEKVKVEADNWIDLVRIGRRTLYKNVARMFGESR